ncbi:MAG TPA: leucyl/phenylalanyl-tRNA--protein transferase [Thermoanaerobaculia bacterium]|nr:leucyl/phenylalanyl-tRNA--protein transferase [Thermoanaerobaculia bacterium]
MAVYRIGPELEFPPPEEAEPSGLLGVGGDLRPERLLLAYSFGIFPWFGEGEPILWFSPHPRAILEPSALRVGRTLRKELRRMPIRVTFDRAFEQVIRACAEAERPGQYGTWITTDMVDAYCRLHRLGFAHSVEAWDDGDGDENTELVGGVYGVSLGSAFFGESMFAARANASKIAFVALVRRLEAWGFDLIDCQMRTEHLERFGAREVPRREFLARLDRSLENPTRRGPWSDRCGESR